MACLGEYVTDNATSDTEWRYYQRDGATLVRQTTNQTATITLLADGLGSARTEMVGSAVETVTTYRPFGSLLAQTGTSGTTYDFTGEQHDSATGLVYLRARYYNPALRVFLSRDPYPGSLGNPATQHGYSYVSNNPVNKTDPSGLCEEVGDETCWGVYEAIDLRYPSAKYNPLIPASHGLLGKQLQELPEFVLKGVLRNLNSNPNFYPVPVPVTRPPSNWDGVAVYGSIKTAEGWFTNQAGIELLFNFHSADLTLFAVIGFGGGAGAATTGDASLVFVYNIGSNNLKYSGNFVSAALGGASGLGGVAQYSLSPEDIAAGRFLNPEKAYSISVGGACGVGGYAAYGITEYMPILTTNLKNHKTEVHDYFYDFDNQFDNGYISGTYQRIYGFLEDFLKDSGIVK